MGPGVTGDPEIDAWIEEQLAKAPPLSDARRARIEALLSLPPDGPATRVAKPRPSTERP
jgi:hypothetical protein